MGKPRECLEGFETCVGPDAPPTRKFRCQTCAVEFAMPAVRARHGRAGEAQVRDALALGGGMNITVHERVRAYMARPSYEAQVRGALDNALSEITGGERGPEAQAVVDALGVFLLSKKTREVLADNDPAAVRQALGAIGIKL